MNSLKKTITIINIYAHNIRAPNIKQTLYTMEYIMYTTIIYTILCK